MAYGARLESVLGASPRGFESPILRHRTPGPLQVPGFSLPAAPPDLRPPRVLPAREPSAPRVVACGAAGVLGAGGPGRLDGPGCFVCPWAAARPRAVRAASFARRVVSKPGQAPPPPTGTAARPSGPSGALHTGGTCVAWTIPARPRRRPPAPRPGPPGPPVPSTPATLVVLCAPAGNRAVTALPSPGLVPLDSEALDDLCARECGQDLARHKELRAAQARADAAPSDRARRVDEEPP